MKKKIIPITLLTLFLVAGCTHGVSSSSNVPSSSDYSSEDISSSEDTSEESSESGIAVSLNYESYSLAVNEDFKLTATVTGTDVTKVTWSTTNENIAYISKYGVVYGLGDGTATITATSTIDKNAYASCEVTVNAIPVEGITLDITSKELEANESFVITPTVSPSGASYKGVVFSSESEEVATVDKDGKITAISVGETNIVATSARYSNIFAKCHIKVNPTALESIKLAKKSAELHINDTFSLVTRFSPTKATNKNVTYLSSDTSIATVTNKGVVTAIGLGTTTITVRSEEGGFTDTFTVTVKDNNGIIKSSLPYDYRDYTTNNLYNLDSTPNDSANLLIVPVWFTDSSNYIKNKDMVRNDIEKAYLGTNEETGWRSVKTYYEEESGGNLSLNGVVTDWYEPGLPASTYGDKYDGMSATIDLVREVCEWYKRENNLSSLSNFDADGNGYLDGVIVIYGAPDHQAGRSNYDNLWAYTYWMQGRSYNSVTDPGPNVFFWASYDFMYGTNKSIYTKYYGGDTSNCNVDAHTFIHEAGHMFGLSDYYDYGPTGNKPASGFSMQDYNVGSHDPYSIMALGWANPYVVTDNQTLTIGTFQETKDLILVTPEFHNSPFDEYILLELYSPTGLNQFDAAHTYRTSYPKGPSKVGVRMWHVDARLLYGNSYSEIHSGNYITTNPCIEGYKVTHMMSNSYGERGSDLGPEYDKYNILELIRNDVNETYNSKNVFAADDLFLEGDVFTLNKYIKQFANNGKLNSGTPFTFTISFVSMTNDSVTITITK